MGVERIKLLQDGKEFFSRASELVSCTAAGRRPAELIILGLTGGLQDLHKFHKRIVTTPAPGFTPLAANNEIILSTSCQVLTFQSHPEFSESLSRGVMADSKGAYSMGPSSHADVDLKDITDAHDGKEVWDTIMGWYAGTENEKRRRV